MNTLRYEYINNGLTTMVLIKTRNRLKSESVIRTLIIDTNKIHLLDGIHITFKKYNDRFTAQYYSTDDVTKRNLSRLILGITDPKVLVTFKNQDYYDFRVENLVLTRAGIVGQNRVGNQTNNTSGIRGVSWHSDNSKWYGQVEHNQKSYYVGSSVNKFEIEKSVIAKRNELHELSKYNISQIEVK